MHTKQIKDRYLNLCSQLRTTARTSLTSLMKITCEQLTSLLQPFSHQHTSYSRAQYAVLQHLGVQKVHVAIGFSMGGQQAYYWAVMYPDFVEKYASRLSTTSTIRPHPLAATYPFVDRRVPVLTTNGMLSPAQYYVCVVENYASASFIEGSKSALLASKDFNNGHYTSPPQHGLRAFARVYCA